MVKVKGNDGLGSWVVAVASGLRLRGAVLCLTQRCYEGGEASITEDFNAWLILTKHFLTQRLRRYIAYPDVGVSAGEGLLAGSS